MINTEPLIGSIEPLIKYLQIHRRLEEDQTKDTKRLVDVIDQKFDYNNTYVAIDDQNYDPNSPFVNTKIEVEKASLTDLGVFQPLDLRIEYKNTDLLAIEVVDSLDKPTSIKYYFQRIFPSASGDLVLYKSFSNFDWVPLDDSNFTFISLAGDPERYLYDDERNRIIYNSTLKTAFAYSDVFIYDPKDVGITSGRYILKYINHFGKQTIVTHRDFHPEEYKHKRIPKTYTNRNINVEINDIAESVYLFPTIKKSASTIIVEYKYILEKFSRFDVKFQKAAITLEFKYFGTFLYFINRTIFYDNSFENLESKRYLDLYDYMNQVLRVVSPNANVPNDNNGIRQLFIDQYLKCVSEELKFYKKKLDKILEIFYYTPTVFIKHIQLETLWAILDKSLKGRITNFGLDKEDITLKLLVAIYEKVKNPRLFLDELLIRRDHNNISYFYNLFGKMHTSNFDRYVYFIWGVWKQTVYKDITEKNPKISSLCEPYLNYKSDQTIGFHHDNADITYLSNTDQVQIDIIYKVTKRVKVKIDKNTEATIPFSTSKKESLLYDPFAPIYIFKEDNPNFIFKDSEENKNSYFAALPAFVMLAREERAFWSNIITAGEFAIDILTTATGFLNIAKAGRLYKILNAGHKLIGRTKQATQFIAGTKRIAGYIEITSGIGNGLIKLLGYKDTELGRTIAKYLFFLEMLSLTGELSAALHASLSKTAKEIVTHPEFPNIKKQAEEIIKKADNTGATKKSKEIVEAEETLEATRHLEEASGKFKIDNFIAKNAKRNIGKIRKSDIVRELNKTESGKEVAQALKNNEIKLFKLDEDAFRTEIKKISKPGEDISDVTAGQNGDEIYLLNDAPVSRAFGEIVHEGKHAFDELAGLFDDIELLREQTKLIEHDGISMEWYVNKMTDGQVIELRARIAEREFQIEAKQTLDFNSVPDMASFIFKNYQ
ncbi:hypothetical protein [Kordia jejudonensis]|uniref:hypothetical protein n=1 Tax=Kordia jejudonensis TaxID=1348245 RepID=UPI0006295AD1|nr:hypothetical protein [Kordia jejudonensis]